MSVDPGTTTGWALFNEDSQKPTTVGEVRKESFFEWLGGYPSIDIWVVEDYIIRPNTKKSKGFDHTWNTGGTLRLIGAIEYHAHIHDALFYKQQPSIKPLAYKQMGAEYKKGKPNQHIPDAIAHGVHFIGKMRNF